MYRVPMGNQMIGQQVARFVSSVWLMPTPVQTIENTETNLIFVSDILVCFCRVVESKDPDFPVGSEWLCLFGWRTHTIYNKKTVPPDMRETTRMVAPLPDLTGLPSSLALGTVGMPG